VDFSVVNDVNGALKTVRERLTAHATNAPAPPATTTAIHRPVDWKAFRYHWRPAHAPENGRRSMFRPPSRARISRRRRARQVPARQSQIHRLLARKAYAYSRGENSEDVPASPFKTANKAFTDSGFRMRALLKAMVEDKDYLQRTAPTPETKNGATKVAAQ
jgi:hypothetical protein